MPATAAEKTATPADPLTLSGIPVRREYGPEDLKGRDLLAETGKPGAYPYTRGLKSGGYRVNPWTMAVRRP